MAAEINRRSALSFEGHGFDSRLGIQECFPELTERVTNHQDAQDWNRNQSQKTLPKDSELTQTMARSSRNGNRFSGLGFCRLRMTTTTNRLNSSMWKTRNGRI